METATPSGSTKKGPQSLPSPKKPGPELLGRGERVLFRDLGKELLVPVNVPEPPYIADYFSKETRETYTPEKCEAMWRHRQRTREREQGSLAPT